MNTAIEADDTHPELRDRARASMTLWHRLIGRIVKDGNAAGTLAPDIDPYALASVLTELARRRRSCSPACTTTPRTWTGSSSTSSAYVETLRVDSAVTEEMS